MFINFSHAFSFNFFEKFQRWKNENVQQRTNALPSRLFEDQLQFHDRKEPQKYLKMVVNFGSVLTN